MLRHASTRWTTCRESKWPRRGELAFGIPAHRSATGRGEPIAARWTRAQAFSADVGRNNGVDNRHQSWQVEPTAMQLFANAVKKAF
jgi:arginine decarboxylase